QFDYWSRHLRQPVQFQKAMETLHTYHQRIFVEIGPNPVLLSLGERCLPNDTGLWVPTLRKNRDDWQQILESLATLYVHGVDVDWVGFEQGTSRRRVPLPTYPFQRKRYWTNTLPTNAAPSMPAPRESTWEAIQAAGDQQAEQGPLDLSLETYPAKWDAFERLSTAYIVHALRELNAFRQPGEAYRLAEFVEVFGIQPKYQTLVGRWLQRLTTAGLLEGRDERFTSRLPLPTPDLEAAHAAARRVALPDSAVLLEYV